MLIGSTQVRRILWKLFEFAPTPEAGALAEPEQIEAIIKPLGLFRKRALMFKRFSREYLEKDVRQLSAESQGWSSWTSNLHQMHDICRADVKSQLQPQSGTLQ